MQPRHPFMVFFFLQPSGYLSPLPCTKVTTLDGSKLKHLHPNGWFHYIFKITFIMSTYTRIQWHEVPSTKGSKMARNEALRPGMERYREIQNVGALNSTFHPKPSGKYCWHGILTCWLKMLLGAHTWNKTISYSHNINISGNLYFHWTGLRYLAEA